MQSRMNNPAMIIPDAMKALYSLWSAVGRETYQNPLSGSSSCAPARSTAAASAWICMPVKSDRQAKQTCAFSP